MLAATQSRIAVASAPECEKKPSGPAGGMPGANVRLSRRAGRIQPQAVGTDQP